MSTPKNAAAQEFTAMIDAGEYPLTLVQSVHLIVQIARRNKPRLWQIRCWVVAGDPAHQAEVVSLVKQGKVQVWLAGLELQRCVSLLTDWSYDLCLPLY